MLTSSPPKFVPIANLGSTAVTPTIDDAPYTVTLPRPHTLLPMTLVCLPTVDPHHVRCALTPSPCRALASIASPSANYMTFPTSSSGTAVATNGNNDTAVTSPFEMTVLRETIIPTDSRVPPTIPAPFSSSSRFWKKLSKDDHAAMRDMSAEDMIQSMKEGTDARNEHERLKDPARQFLDSVTTSILNRKADLLEDKNMETAEIRVHLAALQTRQHQLLQDVSAPVGSTAW